MSIYILFCLAILLHNIEEALWLPKWSESASQFHKIKGKTEFHFAVLMVTILAFLITALFILFPELEILKYIYFGFLGAMIINVFAPHLIATIVLKRYAPGLATGILLNLPINYIIIYKSINNSVITLNQVLFSTVIVGGFLLMILPVFFYLSLLVKEYE